MGKKGFTLIELLIVIAILGILVALILPRFADVRKDANTKVCVANIRGLVSAMNTYEVKENVASTWDWGSYTVGNLVSWDYLADTPACPQGGTYSLDTNTTSGTPEAFCSLGPTGTNEEPTHKWP